MDNANPPPPTGIRALPRNVWAVSLTSFFTDVSSEMVFNLIPFFLANVLGVRTATIGLIEGMADAMSNVFKLLSGWLSDRLRARKSLTLAGYVISALSKPFFYFALSWEAVAGARWADRLGKGVRTAPRDALVADSIDERQRGLAFGLHRAADTGGAVLGILIALAVVLALQGMNVRLERGTFQTLVLISLVPAFLGVIALALGARDVPAKGAAGAPRISFRGLGRPFTAFMLIAALFELGNSADAFLTLRAQERGLNLPAVLGMLVTFNVVYTLVSTPGGALSDRIGRRRVILGGWLVYALIYFGFAFAQAGWQIWALYTIYGIYYGLAYGTSRALVADLVPAELRGTAFGTYNAVVGVISLPASFIAGALWQGVGTWQGFGPSAPFFFGGAVALLATLLFALWRPPARVK